MKVLKFISIAFLMIFISCSSTKCLDSLGKEECEGKIKECDQSNSQLKEENKILKKSQITSELEIDKFLNIKDVSIFKSFKTFNPQKIHQRSRLYYQLITDIHELDSIVSVSDNMRAYQFAEIKENIGKATELMDSVNSYANPEKGGAYHFLSQEQKQYYKDILKRLEMLDEQYNR